MFNMNTYIYHGNCSISQYRTKNQRLAHDEFFFKYFAALELEEEPRNRVIGKRMLWQR
jgi:hypothetical protein